MSKSLMVSHKNSQKQISVNNYLVLRIRDVYPGSGFFPIPDPKKHGEVKKIYIYICFLTFL
jgi:hypothetical protein